MMTKVRSVTLMMILASIYNVTEAFSGGAFPTQVTSPKNSLFEQLQSAPLIRASDGSTLALPSLWRSNTPFGVADEYSVCAFLRHFG
mmetsp:Transcript_41992/g.50388  ORF Transcript_41992/g.50388 Transcript_41992/m.50388 type:complete len:87 (-) Transcript_41992:629-889(-)